MKKMVCSILFIVGGLFPFAAIAGFECAGAVESIAINPQSGILQVNAGYGVHYLCRIHTEHNGVHPAICKTWYSMFLTAQTSGRKITQVYDASAGGAQSCAELGTWKVPNPLPYYVAINKQ